MSPATLSKAPPAMCRTHAQESPGRSFCAVDDSEGMLSARISSAAAQIAEEIKHVVSIPDDAGKKNIQLSRRVETRDLAAHLEGLRERSGTGNIAAWRVLRTTARAKNSSCASVGPWRRFCGRTRTRLGSTLTKSRNAMSRVDVRTTTL